MWMFKLPTQIIFGNGSTANIGEYAARFGAKKMLVTDSFLLGLPQTRKIIAQLGDVSVFSEVQPNPTVANVDALSERLKHESIQLVIALGGGSSIDCAKAAAALAKSGESSIRAFHSGGQKFGSECLPLIAVPTTAGTGSEVTPFAVLDDTEKQIKGPVASDLFYPKLAIIDPELTYSAPLKVTAATALDALSHSIEGYWSKNHQPICDLLAMEAAKNIFCHLGNVLRNPCDKTGREALSYAALIAGMAFQLPKNAIMHACSFPLSNRFHLPHGTACAFTMEGAIRLNAPHMGGRMEKFAASCGFQDLDLMILKITELKKQGGLPCTLEEAGIGKKEIELLVEESFHPLMNNNPKTVTRDDLWKIYSELGE
ncbi:MAG: iron-containing alcohol dehydrogenase family protein [Victivallales bacterium]